MSYQPATRQIVGPWRVWIQHPMLPGFGSFHFYPNGAFYGEQSQQTGAMQIQGQWAFNGTFIRVQGMTNVGLPYNLMLQIVEQGQGYFKAASHDGFAVLFQWAA